MATYAHQPGQNRGANPYSRRSVNREDLRLRQASAIRRRLEGASYYEIGKELQISHTTARKYVLDMMAEYMREHEAETIPRLRAQELQRLDHALREIYAVLNSKTGTELALKAVDRLARVVNLRAELLGLKVPIEVNLKKVEVTQTDLELEEMIREAEVQNEVIRQQILEEAAADGGPTAVA